MASSPQSLTSIVIECTTRPFKLFKSQLLEAMQLAAMNYLQNEHSVRAAAAAQVNWTADDEHW